MDLLDLTLTQQLQGLSDRAFSSLDLVNASLARADALEPSIHAFLELFHDRALDLARSVDHDRAHRRPLGPLAGVPIAIKDNICLDFGKTTCASRMLQNYRSPFSATSAKRLIDAGAVILGKTNLDEFAMGSSTESSAFGPTLNPFDLTRVPGGSSGGSAAAVAARIVPAALGSDTGGSIRQPASHCNIVGFKPTYSRVSRSGLVAYASSLDQIGPMTRSVRDAALLANLISAHDPADSTSLPAHHPEWDGFDLLRDLETPIDKLTIAVPRAARNAQGNHPAVNAALEDAIAVFRNLGALVFDADLEHLDQAIAAYYIIAPAEASSNLARYDGIRFGFQAPLAPHDSLFDLYARSRAQSLGPEVQRRIMLGTHVLSSGYADRFYHTALKARRLIKQAYDNIFSGAAAPRPCHAILMPTAPGPPFRLNEKTADPLALYLEDVYTVGVNLAGLPAIAIPAMPAPNAGSAGQHLPVGVQLIAQAFDDARLLRIAHMFEQQTNYHTLSPTQ